MAFKPICLIFCIGLNSLSTVLAEDYKFDFEINEQASKTSNSSAQNDSLINTWRIGMQSDLFGGWLKGSGKLYYGKFSQGQQLDLLATDKYFFDVNLEAKHNKLGYGVNYFLLGKNYFGEYSRQKYPDKDRTGFNSWLSYDFGYLMLKGSYAESWSNIENNPKKARIYDKWYRIDTRLNFTSTPFRALSFSYGIGDRRRFKNLNSESNSYLGALNYAQVKLEFAFKHLQITTGAYRFSFKKENSNHKEINENVFLNAKIFPDYLISIHPSYFFQQQSFWLGTSKKVKRKSKSALQLLFRPKKEQYRISFTTSYDQSSENYLSETPNTLKLIARIDWPFSKNSRSYLPLDWSLNSRYKQIKGFRNPELNFSDWAIDLNLHWWFI